MYGLWKDTCDTERATEHEDPYRGERLTWADELEGQECRLIHTTQQKIESEKAELLIVDDYQLLLPADADVIAADRVKLVTRQDGVTFGPFRILSLIPRRDNHGVRMKVAKLQLYG